MPYVCIYMCVHIIKRMYTHIVILFKDLPLNDSVAYTTNIIIVYISREVFPPRLNVRVVRPNIAMFKEVSQ